MSGRCSRVQNFCCRFRLTEMKNNENQDKICILEIRMLIWKKNPKRIVIFFKSHFMSQLWRNQFSREAKADYWCVVAWKLIEKNRETRKNCHHTETHNCIGWFSDWMKVTGIRIRNVHSKNISIENIECCFDLSLGITVSNLCYTYLPMPRAFLEFEFVLCIDYFRRSFDFLKPLTEIESIL